MRVSYYLFGILIGSFITYLGIKNDQSGLIVLPILISITTLAVCLLQEIEDGF